MSALALQGIHAWQQRHGRSRRLAGAMLFHPQLYQATPQGGEAAAYLPVVGATNSPLYILQPKLATGYWRMAELRQALEAAGSPVYTQVLAGVSDGFHLRPDASEAELRMTEQLPQILRQAMALLRDHGGVPEAPRLCRVRHLWGL